MKMGLEVWAVKILVLKMNSRRILIIGDSYGCSLLAKAIPRECIVALICAENRPQYHKDCQKLANELNRPMLIQPTLKKSEALKKFYTDVQNLEADLGLCCSYSQLLTNDFIQILKQEIFNIHASLLPKNRGPNPIQWAIIKNENETGISIHRVSNKLDAGNIIAQKVIPIEQTDTWCDLKQKIDQKILSFINETLPSLMNRNYTETVQNEQNASQNPRLSSDSPEIHFSQMDDLQVYNLIRAQVHPLKGAYIHTKSGTDHIDYFIPLNEISSLRSKYQA